MTGDQYWGRRLEFNYWDAIGVYVPRWWERVYRYFWNKEAEQWDAVLEEIKRNAAK